MIPVVEWEDPGIHTSYQCFIVARLLIQKPRDKASPKMQVTAL